MYQIYWGLTFLAGCVCIYEYNDRKNKVKNIAYSNQVRLNLETKKEDICERAVGNVSNILNKMFCDARGGGFSSKDCNNLENGIHVSVMDVLMVKSFSDI